MFCLSLHPRNLIPLLNGVQITTIFRLHRSEGGVAKGDVAAKHSAEFAELVAILLWARRGRPGCDSLLEH